MQINLKEYPVGEFYTIYNEWDYIQEGFEDYINKGLSLVVEKQQDLNQKIEALRKSNYVGDIDYLETDSDFAVHYYEITFLNAGLLFIISQFEHYLKEIEESTYYLFKNKRIIAKPYYKKIIDTRKNNIIKIAHIQNDFETNLKDLWEKIEDYQIIRNKMAHNNGKNITDDRMERWKSIYPCLGIFQRESYLFDIVITKDFLFLISKDLTCFLNKLMKTIHDKHYFK